MVDVNTINTKSTDRATRSRLPVQAPLETADRLMDRLPTMTEAIVTTTTVRMAYTKQRDGASCTKPTTKHAAMTRCTTVLPIMKLRSATTTVRQGCIYTMVAATGSEISVVLTCLVKSTTSVNTATGITTVLVVYIQLRERASGTRR